MQETVSCMLMLQHSLTTMQLRPHPMLHLVASLSAVSSAPSVDAAVSTQDTVCHASMVGSGA